MASHRRLSPHPPIEAFWRWFGGIAPELGTDLENQSLLDELDERVARLGDVSWEVGPGRREVNALVITPDGARNKLDACRHIVTLAPSVPGWEFHCARPPKQWDLQFSLDAEGGGKIEVDARTWRYVLYTLPGNTLDIVLEQNNLRDVTEGDRYTAAVVVLDGILGELKRLDVIKAIEPITTLSEEHSAKASPVDVLVEHLDSLRGDAI
jgi:hypothetical protein